MIGETLAHYKIVDEPRLLICLYESPLHVDFRFWVWGHYAAVKIGRGELFEALDFLTYVRETALGQAVEVHAEAELAAVEYLEEVGRRARSR